MPRTILILLLLAIYFTACHRPQTDLSQRSLPDSTYLESYYQPIYVADIAYMKGDYQTAWELWQSAFSKHIPLNQPMYMELYYAAKVAAHLGHDSLALDYIEALIRTHGKELKTFAMDTVFAGVRSTHRWYSLQERYPLLREAYLQSIDMDLRWEIAQMQKDDQLYRSSKGAMPLQKSLDSINTHKLIQIFETRGYPNELMIGNETVDGDWTINMTGIGTILLHTADSIRMEYFIPKLMQFVRQGSCAPQVLGPVIDQYYLYNKKLQHYGTYTNMDGSMLPVQNPAQLDSLRISIGLPPIAVEAERQVILRKLYGY